MPTVYKRKPGARPRGQWDPERLREAINRIQAGDIKIREAERYYGVPARTISRRMASENTNAPGHGPSSILGPENEERLKKHIKALGDAGFCPDPTDVRRLAFEFAEMLNIKHNFNKEKRIAGYDWLWSFFRRHPDLRVRKAEGLSIARERGLTRESAKQFFDLLEKVVKEHKNIHNVDETGVQLINKVGKVVARKGAKAVNKVTTAEKGETVSLVVCCSAEGRFHPPALIYKRKNLKPEFQDGLPPGPKVYMNQKSAYINSDIFYKWFTEQFLPRKAPGRNILILDGHCSHVSSISLLEHAESNEVTLLCLPPHTTHALQPLDKSFFGPLKVYFKTASNRWVERHVGRKLTRYQVGPLICEAWEKAASVGNGTSGFKATGIYPLNQNALPDYLFTISDNLEERLQPETRPTAPQQNTRPVPPQPETTQELQPGCSKDSIGHVPEGTPSKFLKQISPVPQLKVAKARTNAKKGAVELTSVENRKNVQEKLDEKSNKNSKKEQRDIGAHGSKRAIKKKLSFNDAYSDSDSDIPQSKKQKTNTPAQKPRPNSKSKSLDYCKECGELYENTKKTCDWLCCATCKFWLHDDRTIFDTFCVDCGRENRK